MLSDSTVAQSAVRRLVAYSRGLELFILGCVKLQVGQKTTIVLRILYAYEYNFCNAVWYGESSILDT